MSRRGSRRRGYRKAKAWNGLLVAAAVTLTALWFPGHHRAASQPQETVSHALTSVSSPLALDGTALPAFLPPQAAQTLALIAHGGPFPYPQDGSVFGNFEGHLPAQPRGWYHEYTVETPGLSHRGTRRIMTGGNPPTHYWYTGDHYASFRAFEVAKP